MTLMTEPTPTDATHPTHTESAATPATPALEPATEQVATPPKANFFTVLRNSGFRNLWLGQIVSQVGDYFVFLAMMVMASSFSPDPASTTQAVSSIMFAFTLPRLLFGVMAGVFVDRWDRRHTMIVADVVRAGLSLLLIPAFMAHNLWMIYLVAFTLSAFGTLFNPAKGAVIPLLVPGEQLMAANALSQTSQMLSTFIGPALAGLVFNLAGKGNEWVAFAINSASFAVSAVAVWSIPAAMGRVPTPLTPQPPSLRGKGEPASPPLRGEGAGERAAGPIRQVWHELLVGLRTLLLNRTMATLTVVMGITMLGIGAMNVLWIVFLKTNFGFQEAELAGRVAIVDIAFSAGMVLASGVIGNLLAHIAPKWLVVAGLIVAGAQLAVMGYFDNYWLLTALMFGIGLFVGPINAGITSLMQIVVPNEQMGRVGGGFGTMIDTTILLSVSLAGALGSWLGIPMVFTLSGLLSIGGGLIAFALLPALTLHDKVENAPVEPAAVV